MNKTVGIILGTALFGSLLSGCGTSDVKTGGSNSTTTTTTPSTSTPVKKTDTEKRFNANVSATAVGITVNIAEVKITPDRIEIGVNLQNTNKDKVSYYPDQEAKVIIGDMQLDSNMFMSTGKLGGQIEGGIKQDGVLVFLPPQGKKLDMASITQLKLKMGEVLSSDYMNKKAISFDIPVK